jgi:hypothetical protein
MIVDVKRREGESVAKRHKTNDDNDNDVQRKAAHLLAISPTILDSFKKIDDFTILSFQIMY